MPVTEFLGWVFEGDSQKVSEHVSTVANRLPGVFNRLLSEESLQQDLRSSPFQCDRREAPQSFAKWASNCAPSHSLAAEHVQTRSTLAAIRNLSSPDRRAFGSKQAAASDTAERLARSYALYKLDFLAAQESEMPLTAYFAVQQNYCS